MHLRLFDFSLSRVPLEQTQADTPPYFDPVRRPRWDAAAKCYAVDRFDTVAVMAHAER